jgi:hypothetical protein
MWTLFLLHICIYRDIIEYRDNFLDKNREMIFLISPNRNYNQSSWQKHDLFYDVTKTI